MRRLRGSAGVVGVAVAMIVVLAVSAGAQDALPLVRLRSQADGDASLAVNYSSSVSFDEPSVILPVEPMREYEQPTLASAARAHDYPTFDALVQRARQTREPLGVWSDLHALWTYAVTERTGAFYGADMHARLTRSYPGFGEYIAQYRIVDSNGNVFYPTAETRAFLLREASRGTQPRTLLAESSPIATATPTRRSATTPASPRQTARPRPATPKVAQPVAAKATPAPVKVAAVPPQPAAKPAEPVVIAQPAPVAVPPAPLVQTEPVPVAASTPALQPQQQPSRGVDSSDTTRGLFLIILGLIGIGVLTMMLRTPKSDEVPSILGSRDEIKPVMSGEGGVKTDIAKQELPKAEIAKQADTKPVDPIRLSSPQGGRRATGSHG